MGELLQGFNDMSLTPGGLRTSRNIEELTPPPSETADPRLPTMGRWGALLDGEGRIVLVNPTARRCSAGRAAILEGNESSAKNLPRGSGEWNYGGPQTLSVRTGQHRCAVALR